MFRFKQFTVQQDKTAMKVGTDGVLLGAWANLEKTQAVLDIGTGTGLIALMAAQRNETARIDAIEIEAEAYLQARANVAHSPWADRIKVHRISLFDYFPDHKYDCIICNPPFFTRSTKNPDDKRTLARHNDTLPHDALAIAVSRLLSENGTAHFILPSAESEKFMLYTREANLYPQRITEVYPTPHSVSKRRLISLGFQQISPLPDHLVIELSRHCYSEEYIRLTQDFYLNM